MSQPEKSKETIRSQRRNNTKDGDPSTVKLAFDKDFNVENTRQKREDSSAKSSYVKENIWMAE